MALDGIVMASLKAELKTRLEGGKIAKIAQPEKDELLFTVKNQKTRGACSYLRAPVCRFSILRSRTSRAR